MYIQKALKICSILLLIFLLVTGCGSKVQQEVAVQLIPVEAQRVEKGAIQLTYTAFGHIEPLNEVIITPEVMGQVKEVAKDIGEKTNKDDVLFSIDKEDLLKQLSQMEISLQKVNANIEIAQLTLNDAQGGGLKQQMLELESALEQVKITYESAKEDYENSKVLFESGALAKKALDASKNQFEIVDLQYNTVSENYERFKNEVSKDMVRKAQINLDQAKATKAELEIQKDILLEKLADSDVKAAIPGVIAQRNVEVGQKVSPQTPAYTIVDIDKVIVKTTITERIINQVKAGQEVLVTINALQGKQFMGVIEALSPAITARDVGYTVKIIIENQNQEIKPGMFAEVKFITASKDNVVLIPMETVLKYNNTQIVYVLEEDTAKRREVETGFKDDKNYEITNGLSVGEMVIVKGQQFITDGEKVQLVGGVQQ